ncbi:MAG: hypothetical protein ABMA64_15585 [Myxococcota bacterium]
MIGFAWLGCVGGGQTVPCGDTACKPPPLVPFADCTGDNGEYTLTDARIVDDVLEADVSYGGGCRSHQWELCRHDGGEFLPGDPPVARLSIVFEDNGDTCDLGYIETRTFDLLPLREAWVEGGGSETDLLQISLDGRLLDYP